ncbi:transcriptional regulator, GntR family [Desulfosarcina variabilis str. Montpellier]|uniref:FadR/GntR family transcriptional regulator n=1 Tax=Desulfosarcina variabilis TaxID=2300 RepID=UPI003AFAC74E
MSIRLKPINRQRISDQVLDQLRRLILNGELKPGQKVMTERDLADALNVSRNSIREAINKLVAMGFMEQRQGQGTFVCSVDDAVKIPLGTVMEAQEASLVDLLEMRMGIECNSAAMAARRANAQDLAAMEAALAEMAADITGGGLGTGGDLAFHMAIAGATQNPMQIYIMKNVIDYLHMGISENLFHLYEDPQNISTILKQHQAIYEAIRSGNADDAFQAMKNHIDFVIEFFEAWE